MNDAMQWQVYAPVGVVLVVVAVFAFKMLTRKAPLSKLPASGPLPLGELPQYYEVPGPVLAWSRVKGWALNHVPHSFQEPASIDYVVLTSRLLEFCSGSTGRLVLDFNFLVGAITAVEFQPGAVQSAGDEGLIISHTPSGQTRLIARADLATAIQTAVGNAQPSA
jgi:hypothetical protein